MNPGKPAAEIDRPGLRGRMMMTVVMRVVVAMIMVVVVWMVVVVRMIMMMIVVMAAVVVIAAFAILALDRALPAPAYRTHGSPFRTLRDIPPDTVIARSEATRASREFRTI